MTGTKEQDELKLLHKKAKQAISKCSSLKELNDVRVRFLGRKGELTAILKSLRNVAAELRPKVGQLANEISRELERELIHRQEVIQGEELVARLAAETIDLTPPGKRPLLGKKHLIAQIIEEITGIFLGLGYKVAEGPEVELAYYNFDALNTPETHPSRSFSDTFYIQTLLDIPHPSPDEILLRTQTSPVQIRVMKKTKPPVYVIVPGKVYRPDTPDPTHSPMFHQVEGLAVDKNITFGDLKGTLEVFSRALFGQERAIRFQPHFFPFTEPSAEVLVSCGLCGGQGCRSCGEKGWLEILGCGMVDPHVLKIVGYDPEEVTGFAFGLGIERIAMLRYGIRDIRMLFENDLRFLGQF